MDTCYLYNENLFLEVLKPTKKAITILKCFELNISKRAILMKSPITFYYCSKKSFSWSFIYLAMLNLTWTPWSQEIAKVKKFVPFCVLGNIPQYKDWSALGYSESHIHPSSWCPYFVKPQNVYLISDNTCIGNMPF